MCVRVRVRVRVFVCCSFALFVLGVWQLCGFMLLCFGVVYALFMCSCLGVVVFVFVHFCLWSCVCVCVCGCVVVCLLCVCLCLRVFSRVRVSLGLPKLRVRWTNCRFHMTIGCDPMHSNFFLYIYI